MPDLKEEIRKRLTGLRLDPVRETEIVEELSQHLNDRYTELLADGVSEEDAHQAALAELFENEMLTHGLRRIVPQIKTDFIVPGDTRKTNLISDLWQDLRFGLRMLIKNPGFSTVAILTLALGIGANTAIFSVVNAILLNPFPYKESNRLCILWKSVPAKGIEHDYASYPTFKDWQDNNDVFEEMALVFRPEAAQVTLTEGNEPQRVQASRVSGNFFSLLGIAPILGRTFIAEESRSGEPVAVLSYGLWQNRFGSSLEATGQFIEIDNRRIQIIGVMPASFQFPSKDTQLWMLNTADSRWPQFEKIRLADAFYSVARLKTDKTISQAQDEMNVIASRLAVEYPETDRELGVNVVSMNDHLIGPKLQQALWTLLGGVCFVLMIACTNVAGLMLARGGVREREMAVRTALGASRRRLIRQLLTEGILFSLAGAAGGLLISWIGTSALISLAPKDMPRLDEVGIAPTVFLFTLGISLLGGIFIGLAPALKISRIAPGEAMKKSGRIASVGAVDRRLLRLLVIGEIALAVILLTGASLLIRSFLNVQAVDLGFNTERLLTMQIDLPVDRYEDDERRKNFFQEAVRKVEPIPGVESAAVGGIFGEYIPNLHVIIEGSQSEMMLQDGEPSNDQIVSNNYFNVVGIPLLKGRYFSDRDDAGSLSAIINDTMAQRCWPDENPVGKRFKYGIPGWKSDWLTVVGVVRDILRNGPESRTIPLYYVPVQQYSKFSLEMVVRTKTEPLQLAEVVRKEIRSLDQTVPYFEITTADDRLSGLVAQRRFQTLLMALFSVSALILAATGIYALLHYSVVQRTYEIGIRLALGARSGQILHLIIKEGISLALVGIMIGLIGGLWLTRIVSNLLFDVSATDPLVWGGVLTLFFAVAMVACYLPARRATKVDPINTLRNE
jgi:putative ABC transport system permease protein